MTNAHGAASGRPFVLPANVQRVCPPALEPGFAECDALVRIDVSDAAAMVQGYGPSDLQAAYDLPSSTKGKGQTIAVVDAFGYTNAETDLGTYRSHFGLPACTTANGCFSKLNQTGQAGPYPRGNKSWAAEQAIDIEMISAACPNCHIMLVEANNGAFKNLGVAVDTAVSLKADAVSNSYHGLCTRPFTLKHCADANYDHPGHIVLGSTGDEGYWGSNGAVVPAGLPAVVAVGGTTLTKAGNAYAESVWFGTGGGCSPFQKPAWQTDTGCTGRTAADAAAIGDPNTGVAIYNGKWRVFGGTSVATPLLAAVFGLAANTQKLDSAQSLYTDASDLHDVTTGSNGTCSPAYLCNGEVGYDGPTGNGTPNGIGAF